LRWLALGRMIKDWIEDADFFTLTAWTNGKIIAQPKRGFPALFVL